MLSQFTSGKGIKSVVGQDQLPAQIAEVLLEVQASLYHRALAFRDSHIHVPKDYADFINIVQNGWAYAGWCGRGECEEQIKEDGKATIRCIPLEEFQPGSQMPDGMCIYCHQPAKHNVYFARAY
jgi:prolyl-tRNA synthetase